MSEMNRRDFLVAAGIAAVVLSLPVLQPSAFAAAAPVMPDKPVDVGLLKDYDKDGVTESFAKKPNYLYIVRKDGKLYACLSYCTHKYRPLIVKETEFYCPAHKAEFGLDGTVTTGPAKDALPRYKITLADNGHVMVDCSQVFKDTQWTDPASFIAIKA